MVLRTAKRRKTFEFWSITDEVTDFDRAVTT
jgi:hypothetical protein